MSELFTRVTDPMQARLCDFLVLPPTRRLKLSPKTLSSLGLPNGATCRSLNRTHIVKALFSGVGTRMFFLSSARYTAVSETNRLLNPSVEELVPEIWSGALFPFMHTGGPSRGDEFSTWLDTYSKLKDDFPAYPAAIEHSLRLAGFHRGMTLCNQDRRSLTDDRLATEVCNILAEIGASGSDATHRIPFRESDGGIEMARMCLVGSSTDIRSYSGCSSYGMRFTRGSFLTELVKRGALLIRPSDAMLEAVTNHHLCWYAGIVRQAFRDRIETVNMALDRLRTARKADNTREVCWTRIERSTSKSSSMRMEAFIQALGGMATEAQKGKKK